ncbi:hypothetical protein C4577_01010 [Candidatus Parcubacteria bacterium]|nr:MAG: hypothetical protein C4577_01010 [Candidatus Parcubacteria bacterium]
MNLNKRLLVTLIFIVVGIILILKLGLFKSDSNPSSPSSGSPASGNQVPEQISNVKNWKTINNQNDNYQVSYPNEWKEISSEKVFEVSDENITFSVIVEKSGEENFTKSNVEFEKLYSQENGVSESGKIKLQNITINFHPAIKIQQSFKSDSGDIISLVYQVKGDGVYYFLSFTPFNNESWTKNSAIITNIVDSFKLLATVTPSAILSQ